MIQRVDRGQIHCTRNRWVWKIRHTGSPSFVFEIDTNSIVVASISALEQEGTLPSGTVEKELEKRNLNKERIDKAE